MELYFDKFQVNKILKKILFKLVKVVVTVLIDSSIKCFFLTIFGLISPDQ
jgi:hypothetical protein